MRRVELGGFRIGLCVGLVASTLAACSGSSSSDDDGGSAGTGAVGGSLGTGGSAGKGDAGGSTTEVSVQPLRQRPADRVDLLLMIDNSMGMSNKQELLSQSIPTLVSRLTEPPCVDENGEIVADGGSQCPSGSFPQFRPVTDLHVGVVTSSLGGHGSDQCTTDAKNDFAQLLASRRSGLGEWDGAGFLAWDPEGTHEPPGETDEPRFVDQLRTHVQQAGETGCGYESSLEAWYRFLIDPEPVSDMTNDGTFSVRGPTNSVVLAQRERFLRSDSAVIIVMLSDENDCSIVDENGTQGFLVGEVGDATAPFRMPRASAACVNPNDPCCRVCSALPASGCPDNEADSECSKGELLSSTAEDHPNLRCFKQVQRFGVDLLYPTQRYVDGLTSPLLLSRNGDSVPNPLFVSRDGAAPRDPSAVTLVGILGVPWLDLSDPAERNERELRLLSAEQLAAPDPALDGRTRWDLILGSEGVPPSDPHMLEQIEPRPAGAPHPLAGEPEYAIASASATGVPNVINGHEQNVVGRDDLQYACIFELTSSIPCDPPAVMGNDVGCDCNASESEYNRPTCSYPGGTAAEGIQTHDKAYPSVRQLEVLRDVGERAVVASICPKNVQPMGVPDEDPHYGYNPVMTAVAQRFARVAAAACIERQLATTEDGSLACRLVERFASAECACDAPGERALTEDEVDRVVADAVRDNATLSGQCGDGTGIDCESLCVCEIEQLSGADRDACIDGAAVESGFCFAEAGPLVEQCPAAAKRLIRLPPDLPRKGATLSLACVSQ